MNYLLLLFFCGGALLWRGKPLSKHWRIYPLLAVADVEANFLIVYAYQFTSITSVTLLDCATIPFVMALSTRFLGVRHTR
ncbi:hypothetical protein CYMTET_26879 [Cymbomonas tetramitiformis]|uniref:Uncharacterized protein n=1 Tax=Cymbomonas tetramitiformis TaxID=36881 RepID=A0AAE0KXG4_9CHLO|nr:hypothetical protein CYMTET_26879 [Cymbomonas tetramitiformis]